MASGTKRGGNLYPEQRVAHEIESRRKVLGLSVEQAADMAGISPWSWHKKADGTTPFKVDEIGRLAAAVGASPGWPFISWDAARWLAERG